MSDGIDIDVSEFFEGLNELNARMIKGIERGLGQAASALLSDSIIEQPAIPLDEGTLRGSGSTFVENVFIESSPNVGGKPTPATVLDE
jgi:hypothetical protein